MIRGNYEVVNGMFALRNEDKPWFFSQINLL